jgi:hypothetical protein
MADPLKGKATDPAPLGELYRTTACAFVETLRAARPGDDRDLLIFTSADIYGRYKLGDAPCGLDRVKLWIRHRPRDGAPPPSAPRSRAAPVDESVRAVCTDPAGQMRCLFDQYTSNGRFAKFESASVIDLDRYLGNAADFDALVRSEK